MNIRQQRFAELVASGMAAGPAYIKAGFRVSPNVAKANASRLLTNASVKTRIAELRKPQTAECLMTLDAKRRMLAEIVRTPIGHLGPDSPLCAEYVRVELAGGTCGRRTGRKVPSGIGAMDSRLVQVRVKGYDKLRAIEIDAKLAGHFEPERIEVDDGPSRIESIRERAAFVVSALNRSAELRDRREPIVLGSQNGNGNSGSPPSDNGHHPQPAALSRWGAQKAP